MITKTNPMKELVYKISTGSSEYFKEDILDLTKFYFDGLIGKSFSPEKENMQRQALESLLRAGRLMVYSDYRNNGKIPQKEITDILRPHFSTIVDSGIYSTRKQRDLQYEGARVEDACGMVEECLVNKNIDLIVPVASGGFEPAELIAEDFKIDRIFPVRYSRWSNHDTEVSVPRYIRGTECYYKINGKNILLVEDTISSGITAKEVIKWTLGFYPKKCYFTSVIASDGLKELITKFPEEFNSVKIKRLNEYVYECGRYE